MSRSNPTLENPADKWWEWDATEGTVKYYDKEAEEEVLSELPFAFLPLDILSTVKGWHERSESSIYASEVKRIDLEPIRVKSFSGGLIAQGLYSNIKDRVKAAGGKFTKSIYLAYKDDEDNMRIGNLQVKGAALQAWIEFSRKVGRQAIEQGAVIITGAHQEKNGSITYMVPEFRLSEVSPKGHRRAAQLDKELQEYLDNKTDHVDIPEEEPAETDDMSSYRDEANGTPPQAGPHPAGDKAAEGLYGGEDMLADVDEEFPF